MTSPPTKITIQCSRCHQTFETWHRASINLDLDPYTEEELQEATRETCPSCRLVIPLETLVVDGDTWTIAS